MKAGHRNFIDNLTSAYKAAPAKVKKEEISKYSLFETIFDIANKYKNKLFTNNRDKLNQINQLCKTTIKNNQDKIKNLAPNAHMSINISLPKDGDFNTTFLTLQIKNTGHNSFSVYYEDTIIMDNVSIKSLCNSFNLNISSKDSKKLTSQVKLFKFHDIKEKLSLFNIIAMHFKSLSNKIKYHIASYAKYKSTNINNQKNIVTTLGYFADLGYIFHNQQPIATKFGMKEPGKIKFSKENIIYSEDKIELTNREQLFDVCLKIVSSKELLSNFTTVSVNIKNKEEVVELVANLLRCYKSFNKKPIANLSKHELSTLVSKLSSTKNLNVTMIEDNLKLLGTLKGLGYPIDDVAISPEGKITLTSPKSWEKVLDIVSNKNNSNKQEFLSILEKNNSCLFIQQAPKSQKFNYHTHLTEQNIEQIFLDFERPGSLFTIDKVQFTETIFKTRFEKLRKENHGTKLAVKLFKEIAADESLDVATRELFKKMTDEDEKFTPYGEKILKLLILSTQTYNPEILGAMAISSEIARSGNNVLYMAVGTTLTNINNLLSRQNAKPGVPRYQETSNISFNTATDEVSITSPLDVPVSVKGKLEDGILTVTESAVSPFASIILNEKYRGLLQHSDPSTYSRVYEPSLFNLDQDISISDTCISIEQKALSNELASKSLFDAINDKTQKYSNYLEKSFAAIIDQSTANRLKKYNTNKISAFWQENIYKNNSRQEVFKTIKDPNLLHIENNSGSVAPQIYIIDPENDKNIIRLGLSARIGAHELRGQKLINEFKKYKALNPDASLYDLINSNPPIFSKDEILNDQQIIAGATHFSTNINERNKIIDSIYSSINNGAFGLPYQEYPFNKLTNKERRDIYKTLTTTKLSLSQIKDVVETIARLKIYGYDPSKISLSEDGTLTLTDHESWQSINAIIKVKTTLNQEEIDLLKLLVRTQHILSVQKPIHNLEINFSNNYTEAMHGKIWTDFNRCNTDNQLEFGENLAIKFEVIAEELQYIEGAEKMSSSQISKAVISKLKNNKNLSPQLRTAFANMITEDGGLNNAGEKFICKLYIMTQAFLPEVKGVVMFSAKADKVNPTNSALFGVGVAIGSIVSMMDQVEKLKSAPRLTKCTFLDSGKLNLNISGEQLFQLKGHIIETADGQKLKLEEVRTPLFWDLAMKNLDNSLIEEFLENSFPETEIKNFYVQAKTYLIR